MKIEMKQSPNIAATYRQLSRGANFIDNVRKRWEACQTQALVIDEVKERKNTFFVCFNSNHNLQTPTYTIENLIAFSIEIIVCKSFSNRSFFVRI